MALNKNVRSYYDDHSEYQCLEPGGRESQVDESLYEETRDVVARLTREGGLVGYTPDMEGSVDEAFASADPTRKPGFDLADIPGLENKRAEMKAELRKIEARIKENKEKEAKRLASNPAEPLKSPVEKKVEKKKEVDPEQPELPA